MNSSTVTEQERLLSSLENDYLIQHDNLFMDMVNYTPRSDIPIHGWFKYREGYSVDLIDRLLRDQDNLILDPFCGCGTTLLSAKKRGIESVGIDINPISAFVSKVKTQNYTTTEVKNIITHFQQVLQLATPEPITPPDLSIINKAFHPEILHRLLTLRSHILKIENIKVRDFLELAYLSIIEDVSNTYKEGNGIKYKFTKRTKEGYIRIPIEDWYSSNLPTDKLGFVDDTLKAQVFKMVNDLEISDYPTVDVHIFYSDSRKLDTHVEDNTVSLCAFSPPYCNCFDYFEIFKLELWMGGFVNSYQELRELRRQSIRSNTNSNLNLDLTKYTELENFISLINIEKIWNKILPEVIRGYFSDMGVVLEKIYQSLENNGRCNIIVGNSAYGGVLIPTDLIISEIAKEMGFHVEKIIVARHLTTSSQQKKELEPVKQYLRESVICLKK